ncbi:MAG TPA: anti-sigma factor [Flavobacterium sp.]|jgi:archaellum component FlaF (FlaF/FlaG flagellin family)
METREYIESGILELYVYGLLDESDNLEVAKMAKQHREVAEEIVAIESAVIHLTAGFSPILSAEIYERIKDKLNLKPLKVVKMKRSRGFGSYLAWAAILVLLLGVGYLYYELGETYNEVKVVETERSKLLQSMDTLKSEQLQTETALAVVRDTANTVITLAGQQIAPTAVAKVYYNKQTLAVYIDAAGLPEPPQGMVYQAWSLKLDPLTPTSIGLLENFTADKRKVFAVSTAENAEGFAITLEPAGGSVSPTLEQLYVLGKV